MLSFIRGGSATGSNPLTFYIPFFERKGTPLVYLLWTNGTPEYLVYNNATLLAAINALSLNVSKSPDLEAFLDVFTATKCVC